MYQVDPRAATHPGPFSIQARMLSEIEPLTVTPQLVVEELYEQVPAQFTGSAAAAAVQCDSVEVGSS